MAAPHQAPHQAPHSPTPSLTLRDIQQRCGTTLLEFPTETHTLNPSITGMWLHDATETPRLEPGTLVLAPGVSTPAQCEQLSQTAAKHQASAVIVPPGAAVPPRLATQTGLTIIRLRPETSWLHLISILQPMLTEGQFSAEPDLFDIANSLAQTLGGPVTVENLDSRILAFSADQNDADEARKLSVLGHQVPQRYATILHDLGSFHHIYGSREPVFIEKIAPGVRPRVGMRIFAGGEALGSLWVIMPTAPNREQSRALQHAADVVALHLLRARTATDAAVQMRQGLVAMLLEGGAAAEAAAARIGSSRRTQVTLAAGLDGIAADTVSGEAALGRVAESIAAHLHAVRPLSVVSRVGASIYAVIPGSGTEVTEPALQAEATRLAAELVQRMNRDDLFVGVGGVVATAGRLHISHEGADAALRVLLAKRAGAKVRVCGVDEVRVQSMLLQLADSLAARSDDVTGPIALLREHDAVSGTQLLESLRVWLDAMGDVATAAAELHVHQNTLRYRLRKVRVVAGVDIDDPEQRFALMLQLRLFAQ